jgi:hypothetical protein
MKGKWALLAVAVAFSSIGAVPQPTNAAAGEGFTGVEHYPSRETSYDSYLAEEPGVDPATFETLYNHIAFPQSRGAMVSLLGWPIAYEGEWDYYRLAGSNDEIAIYYVGDTAAYFTVGY